MQYRVLVVLLQEIHSTCSDKLTILGFALAGSSLSRKHGLATFVHDRLKWTLVEQSPTTSETGLLCMDVDGYRIVNVYKPPPTRLQASDLPVFPPPVLYAGILIVCMSTRITEPALLIESALLLGQALTALSLSTTQRMCYLSFWPLEPNLI